MQVKPGPAHSLHRKISIECDISMTRTNSFMLTFENQEKMAMTVGERQSCGVGGIRRLPASGIQTQQIAELYNISVRATRTCLYSKTENRLLNRSFQSPFQTISNRRCVSSLVSYTVSRNIPQSLNEQGNLIYNLNICYAEIRHLKSIKKMTPSIHRSRDLVSDLINTFGVLKVADSSARFKDIPVLTVIKGKTKNRKIEK